MFVSMEDLMIRYHRMKGVPALWVPGTDHAGIATQLQVEKALAKRGHAAAMTLGPRGIRQAHLGVEGKIRRHHHRPDPPPGRLLRLGRASASPWMTACRSAVREAFVRLYEKGLIYRGPRMINWSPGLRTAVSDLEVEYSEEPGTLYYFKYMLADGSGEYHPGGHHPPGNHPGRYRRGSPSGG